MSAIPGSEPFTLESGSIAILMIHGFTGSPLSVKPWAQALHKEGFTVHVPRLPGHGTNWEELNQTTWRDWFDVVERDFQSLRKKIRESLCGGFLYGWFSRNPSRRSTWRINGGADPGKSFGA